MGIFNILKKKSNKSLSNNTTNTIIDRKQMDPDYIDQCQRAPASEKYTERIIRKYYINYPEKPFISKDREENTNWEENAAMYGIVDRKMMMRYGDGLLPGDVYLLFWVGKRKSFKRVPAYFEYRYGISFDKELAFLRENGYLQDFIITDKGAEAIVNHYDVIDSHNPNRKESKEAKKKYKGTKLITLELNSDFALFEIHNAVEKYGRNLAAVTDSHKEKIENDIQLLNSNFLPEVAELLNENRGLIIDCSNFAYDNEYIDTYFAYNPLTKTGKPSKFPVTFHYRSKEVGDCQTIGRISYLNDGRIGKANLNFWFKNTGYSLNLAMNNNVLVLKSVDKMISGESHTVYKI